MFLFDWPFSNFPYSTSHSVAFRSRLNNTYQHQPIFIVSVEKPYPIITSLMENLQYGNNLIQLSSSSNKQFTGQKPNSNWLIISPQNITLQGMLLTANFNVKNAHEHLSINFQIKSFIKGQ